MSIQQLVHMYTYSAYDLRLRSVFELPELPAIESDGNAPDIEIVRGTVEPVPETVEGRAAGGSWRLPTPSD